MTPTKMRRLLIICVICVICGSLNGAGERRLRPADFVTIDGARLQAGVIDEGAEAVATVPIPVTNDYTVRIAIEAVGEEPVSLTLKIDGATAHRFEAPAGAPTPEATVVQLARGEHRVSLRPSGGAARLSFVDVIEIPIPSSKK